MSQNNLVYLEALKASETTEAPGIGLSTSSDKLSIPSGVKTRPYIWQRGVRPVKPCGEQRI